MQTCTICHAQSDDAALACVNCHADLRESSETAVALKEMRENDRVSAIRIQVYDDACPICRDMMGTYTKDEVPALPTEGCSHHKGCRCFYAPVLKVMYP